MPRSWVAPPAALASMSAPLPMAVLRNGRACQRTRLSAFLTRCSRSQKAGPALMIVFRLALNVLYCHRSCLPPAVGVSAPCVIGPPDKAAPVVRPDDSRWKRRQPVPPRAAAASAGRPFGSHRQRVPPRLSKRFAGRPPPRIEAIAVASSQSPRLRSTVSNTACAGAQRTATTWSATTPARASQSLPLVKNWRLKPVRELGAGIEDVDELEQDAGGEGQRDGCRRPCLA